jgi:acetoin utilization deacetylase AcuC-like enzyme
MVPIINHPDYVAKINDDHKFPIKKFGELFKLLKHEGIINEKNLHIPTPATFADLSRVHTHEYIEKIDNLTLTQEEERKLGFPMIASVRQRSFVATGGTILAAKLALREGLACNTAGGSHHAFANAGNGYCVFNDVAVAAKKLITEYDIKNILIFDLDVHQGDGTAKIFENNENVFTLSIHSKNNYPLNKQLSDLDIELDEGVMDDEYLEIVFNTLQEMNKKEFDYVFYIAGVDVHEDDRIGKFKISTEGIKRREELVIHHFYKKKIPLCGVLGGGYNKDFNQLVYLHSLLHRTCHNLLHYEY